MKLELKTDDYKTILDGLEALKSKGFAGKMMGDIFGRMLEKKPEDMSPDELRQKKERDAKKEREEIEEKIVKEELSRKIDVLKAKIILAQDESLSAQEVTASQ